MAQLFASQDALEVLVTFPPREKVSQAALEVPVTPPTHPQAASAREAQLFCGPDLGVPVCARLEVAWDGVNWTDESANFIQARGQASLASRAVRWLGLGLGGVSRVTVNVQNARSRYSPDNASGPLYPYLQGGGIRNTPLRISASVGTASGVLFTGYIRNARERAAENTVVWECEDISALLSDQKISTSLYCGLRTGDYVKEVLSLAGVPASQIRADPGYVQLPYAWMDDESVWQELGLVAEAEGGRVYVDPQGVIRFEDAAHSFFKSAASVPRLSCSNFQDLEPEYDWQNHYTKVNVEYFGRAPGPRAFVYEYRKALVVPPGSSFSLSARLNQPATQMDDPSPGIHYQAYTAGGEDLSAYVSASLKRYAQRADLSWTNGHPHMAAYLSGIRLVGIPLLAVFAGVASASDAAAASRWGELVLELPDNVYLQDWGMANYLATFLLDRLKEPHKFYRVRGVPGSFGLFPGDLVELVETRTATSVLGQVAELRWRLGPGFSMDLVVVDFDLLPYDDYFILDVSQWGGSRYWY